MNYQIELNQRTGKKISERWLNKIIKQTLRTVGVKAAEISIALVGDKEMRALNKQWRGKNRVTDVLSFTYEKKPLMGEIIICYPQAARQAKENKYSLKEEIKLLLIHGLLHLCGYEHEKSEKEARRMARIQKRIMNQGL